MFKSVNDTNIEKLIEDADDKTTLPPDEDYSEFSDESTFINQVLLKLYDAVNGPNGPDPESGTYLDYYYSQQNASLKSWQRDIPANIVMPLIETQVGQITDDPQYLSVVPKSAGRSIFANFKSSVLNEVLDANNSETLDEQWVRCSHIFGDGICKAWYDKSEKEIRYDLRDPRNIAFDPAASYSDLRDCEYIFEWKIVPISQVMEEYPRAKDCLSMNDDVDTPETPRAKWAEDILNVNIGTKDYIALVEYYYIRRYHDGKKTRKEKRRIVFAQDIILENEKWTYKYWPYGTLPNVGNRQNPTNSIRGTSSVRIIKLLQDEINRTWTQIAAIREYMVNPRVIISAYSGLYQNISEITGGPGEVWPMEDINEVKFDSGEGPKSVLYDHIVRLRETAEMALGIYDVSQGRRAKNIVSGAAIEALQNAGKTRPRAFQRAYKRSKRHLGRILLELIAKHYDYEKQIDIAGLEGKRAYDMVQLLDKDINDDNLVKVMLAFDLTPYQVEEAQQILQQLDEKKKKELEIIELPIRVLGNSQPFEDRVGKQQYTFEFIGKELFSEEEDDVRVENTTFLPTDPSERQDLYIQLRQMGDLDRKSLFEALRLPNAEEIEMRLEAENQQRLQMEQMKQQIQNMQQQQAQQQAPPMGGMPPEQAALLGQLSQPAAPPEMGMPAGM